MSNWCISAAIACLYALIPIPTPVCRIRPSWLYSSYYLSCGVLHHYGQGTYPNGNLFSYISQWGATIVCSYITYRLSSYLVFMGSSCAKVHCSLNSKSFSQLGNAYIYLYFKWVTRCSLSERCFSIQIPCEK